MMYQSPQNRQKAMPPSRTMYTQQTPLSRLQFQGNTPPPSGQYRRPARQNNNSAFMNINNFNTIVDAIKRGLSPQVQQNLTMIEFLDNFIPNSVTTHMHHVWNKLGSTGISVRALDQNVLTAVISDLEPHIKHFNSQSETLDKPASLTVLDESVDHLDGVIQLSEQKNPPEQDVDGISDDSINRLVAAEIAARGLNKPSTEGKTVSWPDQQQPVQQQPVQQQPVRSALKKTVEQRLSKIETQIAEILEWKVEMEWNLNKKREQEREQKQLEEKADQNKIDAHINSEVDETQSDLTAPNEEIGDEDKEDIDSTRVEVESDNEEGEAESEAENDNEESEESEVESEVDSDDEN